MAIIMLDLGWSLRVDVTRRDDYSSSSAAIDPRPPRLAGRANCLHWMPLGLGGAWPSCQGSVRMASSIGDSLCLELSCL